jgi:hypothetical protein
MKHFLVGAAALGLFATGAFAQTPPACKARQLEVYQEGGDAGLGSQGQYVGLRNVSTTACTLHGVPGLHFFDRAGHVLNIPYSRNRGAMMEQSQPESTVTLAPGDFATFTIGTNTGNMTHRFHEMRMTVPGDDTSLLIAGEGAKDGIDVSAFVPGVDKQDLDWAAPVTPVASTGGSTPGLELTLSVPEKPVSEFPVHISMHNISDKPQKLPGADCTFSEELTNSAGHVVRTSVSCGQWSGHLSANYVLQPGDRASADFTAGDAALQLCRVETWTDKLTLLTEQEIMVFAPVAYSVSATQCSDSEHVGDYVDPDTIRWTLVAQHGVRLGVAVTTKNGTPATGPFFEKRTVSFQAPLFHVREPVELRLYLDNLTDKPIDWRSGPGAFRTVVREAGKTETLPQSTSVEGKDDTQATVLPHRWQYVQTVSLTDQYKLGPGNYEVIVGTRTLLGDATAANSPATGWPYTPGSAAVETFVKIVP